jgi:hypothetical protein
MPRRIIHYPDVTSLDENINTIVSVPRDRHVNAHTATQGAINTFGDAPDEPALRNDSRFVISAFLKAHNRDRSRPPQSKSSRLIISTDEGLDIELKHRKVMENNLWGTELGNSMIINVVGDQTRAKAQLNIIDMVVNSGKGTFDIWNLHHRSEVDGISFDLSDGSNGSPIH